MPVEVDVTPRELVVRISGWDAVWALTRGVTVPLAEVRNAAALRRHELGQRFALRMPGTAWPGRIKAGRYVGKGFTELWATYWPERMLVVTCAPGSRYDRLVLEVDDPDRDVAMILAALR